MEAKNLADLYELPLMDWGRIEARLDEGAFWVCTSPTSRKGRNLARDPRCALSVATRGYDLVVEGSAVLVTDPAEVARMAGKWAESGWPCRVDESGTAITAEYSAPSAGPPPWSVYRIEARSATALGTSGEGGATRWTF